MSSLLPADSLTHVKTPVPVAIEQQPARNSAPQVGDFFQCPDMRNERKQAIAKIVGLVTVQQEVSRVDIIERTELPSDDMRYALGFLIGKLPADYRNEAPKPAHVFLQKGYIHLEQETKLLVYRGTPYLHELAADARENYPILWDALLEAEALNDNS